MSGKKTSKGLSSSPDRGALRDDDAHPVQLHPPSNRRLLVQFSNPPPDEDEILGEIRRQLESASPRDGARRPPHDAPTHDDDTPRDDSPPGREHVGVHRRQVEVIRRRTEHVEGPVYVSLSGRPDEHNQWYKSRNYAAPFGYFEGAGEAEVEHRDCLVGREGQRGFLLRLLFQNRRNGAFLVTGRRGAGKSTFVRECLREYTSNSLGRFLRSDSSRVILWDRLIVLLIGVLGLALPLMAAEVLELLLANDASDSRWTFFRLIAAIPFILLILVPLVSALQVLRTVLDRRPAGAASRLPTRLRFVLVVGLISVIVVAVLDAQSAISSASRVLIAVMAFLLMLRVGSVTVTDVSLPPIGVERPLTKKRVPIALLIALGLFVSWAFIWLYPGTPFATRFPAGGVENAGMFAGFLASNHLILGIWSFLDHRHHRSPQRRGPPSPDDVVRSKLSNRLQRRWYYHHLLFLLFSGACIATYVATGDAAVIELPGTAGVFAVVAGLLAYAESTPSSRERIIYQPRPELVLGARAFAAFAFVIQLALPVSSYVAAHIEPTASKIAVASRQRSNASATTTCDELVARLRSPSCWPTWGVEKLKDIAAARTLFEGDERHTNVEWLLIFVLVLMVLYRSEYDEILLPYAEVREEASLTNRDAIEDPADAKSMQEAERDRHLDFAHLALPSLVHRWWLPVLPIWVNLGFEPLEHRDVVNVMLAGLRRALHDFYFSWTSPVGVLRRVLGLALLVFTTRVVGHIVFEPKPPLGPTVADVLSDRKFCESFHNLAHTHRAQIRDSLRIAGQFICGGDEKYESGLAIFHASVLGRSSERASFINGKGHRLRSKELSDLKALCEADAVPTARSPAPMIICNVVPCSAGTPFIPVYYVVLFALFALLGYGVRRSVVFSRLQRTLRLIDLISKRLNARLKREASTGLGTSALLHRGDKRAWELDPSEPRGVEFALLEVLRLIRPQQDRERRSVLSLGITKIEPEIVFVFDELDKIGSRAQLHPGEAEAVERRLVEVAERRRSLEVHRLLADMKNLLATAPSRFIFVGGRNLHDEWLADQTARTPLLANIFDAEVYLPSLLVDTSPDEVPKWERRIAEFLCLERARAQDLHQTWLGRRVFPAILLGPLARSAPGFSQRRITDRSLERFRLDLRDTRTGASLSDEAGDITSAFVCFLAMRSMGIPKRLQALFNSFVRPASRVVRDADLRWSRFDCEHVLSFSESYIYRIQAVAELYRLLGIRFERRSEDGDDKLVSSVFYLTDFLFKFHMRAFSWSNLERVDEIVDIHRAFDHRAIVSSLAFQWSRGFLRGILTGMYDFRMRYGLSCELQHLSRVSKSEMAALNFTLDESQALKALFEANIATMKDSATPEILGGLGELHEFDQEYELARHYYYRAIRTADRLAGIGDSDGKGGFPKNEVLERLISRNVVWAITRLRFLMQVGLTYELSQNHEQAQLHYRDARSWAWHLLESFSGSSANEAAKSQQRLQLLKHLSLLFQPVFAESWLLEKVAGGVDTSIGVVEDYLTKVQGKLPFIRESHDEPLQTKVSHSNFSLTFAELCKKAGDLYFFKGLTSGRASGTGGSLSTTGGYQLRAHYHYALALHEIRHFVSYRRRSSKMRLEIHSKPSEDPIRPGDIWPDFVCRSAGSTLVDTCESILARTSTERLRSSGPEADRDWDAGRVDRRINAVFDEVTAWIEDAEVEGEPRGSGIQIEDWLGHRNAYESHASAYDRTLDFNLVHEDIDRLEVSFLLWFVGAKLLARGGYIEDAAHEYLAIAQAANRFAEWLTHAPLLGGEGRRDESDKCDGLLSLLSVFSVRALELSATWYRRSRRVVPSDGEGSELAGARLPERLAIETYATVLVAPERVFEDEGLRARLTSLVVSYGVIVSSDGYDDDQALESRHGRCLRRAARYGLTRSVERNVYPVAGRLRAMSAWLGDAVRNRIYVNVHSKNIDAQDAQLVSLETVLDVAERYQSLARQFDAPLHVTDRDVGSALGMVAEGALVMLASRDEPKRLLRNSPRIARLARNALEALNQSHEMVTMRRRYYQLIQSCFYLYDDFGDRDLHFAHAMQMAGLDFTVLLKDKLGERMRQLEPHARDALLPQES